MEKKIVIVNTKNCEHEIVSHISKDGVITFGIDVKEKNNNTKNK